MDGGGTDFEFLRVVSQVVDAFVQQTQITFDCPRVKGARVLLFPPLSSRHRFLIHKYVGEEYSTTTEGGLHSFSVGCDENRQTVVCPKAMMKKNQHNLSSPANVIMQRPSVSRNSPAGKSAAMTERETPSNVSVRNTRIIRRPDKQLYVPKARRSDNVVVSAGLPSEFIVTPSEEKSAFNDDDQAMVISCNESEQSSDDQHRSSEQGTDESSSRTSFNVADESFSEEPVEEEADSKTCVKPLSPHITVNVIQLTEETGERESDNVQVDDHQCANLDGGDVPPRDQVRRRSFNDDWFALYDDSGDCLDSASLAQLTEAVGKVSIQTPTIDYLSSIESETRYKEEEFGHIVEIYDFPVEFKTQDLVMAFFKFKHLGFDIKWVDDTHALGVFSSRTAAQAALETIHPFVKTRPLSQAIKESKKKAMKCSEFLQPYKPRPETSAVLARRLVAGALGLQLRVSKEQRDEEMRKIREAKDRRRLAVKQKEAAWNGLVDS